MRNASFISVIRQEQAAICCQLTVFCHWTHFPILLLLLFFFYEVVLEIVSKWLPTFCICRYCFPFGRPDGALKATLSLQERVIGLWLNHILTYSTVVWKSVCPDFLFFVCVIIQVWISFLLNNKHPPFCIYLCCLCLIFTFFNHLKHLSVTDIQKKLANQEEGKHFFTPLYFICSYKCPARFFSWNM